MTTGVDFVTRAHALWRVRMAQWQQRLRFFSTLSLCATGAGAIIAPQFLLMPEEIKVAMQCMLANLIALLGQIVGKDLNMNVSMDGQSWTVSASGFASDPSSPKPSGKR
jgi:hypothetical protein